MQGYLEKLGEFERRHVEHDGLRVGQRDLLVDFGHSRAIVIAQGFLEFVRAAVAQELDEDGIAEGYGYGDVGEISEIGRAVQHDGLRGVTGL